MVNFYVGGEAEGFAGPDGDGGGADATRALVAAEVVGRQVDDGGVVVGVLADVLEHSVLNAARRQLLEDVVGRRIADGQREGGYTEETLHRM